MKKEALFELVERRKTILKILIASVLLWFVFRSIDVGIFVEVVKDADFLLLGIAFALAIVAQVPLSTLKWSVILKAYGTSIPFYRLCNMYLTGMFFSMFLPGSSGGDLVRAHKISKRTEKKVEGVMSVILDRVTGLIGLLAITLFALLMVDQSVISLKLRVWGLVAIAAFFMAAVLFFSRTLAQKTSFLFGFLGCRIKGWAKEIYETIYKLKKVQVIIEILFLSILFQFLVVLVSYIVALSFNVKVPFVYFMLTIPVISLLTMIPLTPSGIGVRDISFIGILGLVGIGKEAAFSIGVMQFLMAVIMSLYGGLVYLKQK